MATGKIDFEKAKNTGLAYVTHWITDGKREGNEWVCRNPTRPDSKAGSFKINLVNGRWSDFATNDKGGDAVSLYAYLNKVTQGEAAKEILTKYAHQDYNPPPKKTDEETWTPILPIPDNAPPPNFSHSFKGNPSHIFPYEDRNGKIQFYVLRWENSEGKSILPYSYCKSSKDRLSWRHKRPESLLPLFGLPLIFKDKSKPIVLVEGEKKALLLRSILTGYIVVAWCGGSKAIKNTDWSTLAERDVILWADNDEPGKQAVEQINDIICNYSRVRFANIPPGKPQGWDCGDAVSEGWKESEILTILQKKHEVNNIYPFRALGYDHGNYFFLSARSAQVLTFSGNSLGRNSLMQLAPLHFWEDMFPSKSSVAWDAAVDTVIGLCEKAGPYDSSRVRGRGAWFDNSRIVLHLGNRLLVNFKKEELTSFDSHYIYESRPPIPTPTTELNSNEHNFDELTNHMRSLNWENEFHGDLLTGWCVVSTICGALDWRPHIWLTGPSGSGKSWVMENIISKVVGKQVLYGLGGSSAVGLRQENGNDAQPIFVEEAEPKNKHMQENIQEMLFMARQSSSEGGGVVFKGTQSGKSMRFLLRNCWLFSSISVGIQDQADESRITVLSLRPNFGQDSRDRFLKFKEKTSALLTPRFCDSLRARAIRLIPVIRENSKVFAKAAATVLNSQRVGDQIGTLCAGVWALIQDEPVTLPQALDYLAMHDMNDQKRTSEVKDEEICLSTLLQSLVRALDAEDRQVTPTIGEIVARAANRPASIKMTIDQADAHLRRIGLRVKHDYLYVQNGHPEIKKILSNTAYSSNYHLILKRITDSKSGEKIRMLQSHNPVRACAVPLKQIFDDSLED